MKGNLDNDVIADFVKGSEDAFRKIYDYFYEQLFYFAYKLTDSTADSEDIVAESFYKLYQLRHNFDNFNNVRAFLYISVRNNCFNYLRYKERKTARNKEFAAQMEDEGNMEYEKIFLQTIDMVLEAVESLPPECKRVFKMYYYDGIGSSKIAETLNITDSTVRNHRSKAIKLLRITLSERQLFVACYMLSNFAGNVYEDLLR